MKHIHLFVYLFGSLLMFDFEWILHADFLGWIGAFFMTLWFFGQIEKDYGGWNAAEIEIKEANEELNDDTQYITEKEAREIAKDVCKEILEERRKQI